MTVHLLRETAQAGPVKLCRVACSTDTFKTEPGGSLQGFASGWAVDVDCEECLERPVPWTTWKRQQGGDVRNFGTVRLIPRPVEAGHGG